MRRHRFALISGMVLLLAATIAGGSWVLTHDDATVVSSPPDRTTTTTTTASTTSSSSTTTTSTTAPPTTTTAAPTTTGRPTTTSAPVTTTSAPPSTTTSPPVTGGDRSVYVLGDSVLLGTRETLPAALHGWVVTMDCVGSRRLPQGIEVLRANRSRIGAVVVIMLGNNYLAGEGSFAAQIDEAMTVLRGTKRVVWVTVAEKWPSRVMINQAIRSTPSRWPTAVVADWAPIVAAHPEYAADELHLSASGRIAISNLIAGKVGPAPSA